MKNKKLWDFNNEKHKNDEFNENMKEIIEKKKNMIEKIKKIDIKDLPIIFNTIENKEEKTNNEINNIKKEEHNQNKIDEHNKIKYKTDLHNIVCVSSYDSKINLKRISCEEENVKYNPKRFTASRCVMDHCTVLVYNTGKFVKAGGNGFYQTLGQIWTHYENISNIKEIYFVLDSKGNPKYTKLTSMRYHTKMKKKINIVNNVCNILIKKSGILKKITLCHIKNACPFSKYIPKMFPGVRLNIYGNSIHIFDSGNFFTITLPGLKKIEDLVQIIKKITKIFSDAISEYKRTLFLKKTQQDYYMKLSKKIKNTEYVDNNDYIIKTGVILKNKIEDKIPRFQKRVVEYFDNIGNILNNEDQKNESNNNETILLNEQDKRFVSKNTNIYDYLNMIIPNAIYSDQ